MGGLAGGEGEIGISTYKPAYTAGMAARFEWILTADGSPSLIGRAGAQSEAMHSRAGAFTESVAIYDRATEKMLAEGWPGHVLSVGLGLGYNEIILAARYLAHRPDDLLSVTSLESSADLTGPMTAWLIGRAGDPAWHNAYETIAARAAVQFGLTPGSVRGYLGDLYAQGRWTIGGALNRETNFAHPASAIFYDAYSSKTCPEMWEEALLSHVLTSGTAEKCVFTTYALTGTLKRALAAAGFTRLEAPGFAGKRHSTLAVRRAYSS